MSSKTLNAQIRQRIDTTANWNTNSSTVLANGELGLERTTDGEIKIKVGDGSTTWTNLSYISTGESSTDEIYVGTSAPTSGHGYTMWINPNGDELEVSGTYDIVLTYEKTNHEPFDTSTDEGDYDSLSYYLNIDDTTHQSLLLNPETGCQLSYDTDWDTILEKYQANQTLILNLQVIADENTYTWKLPLLTALLDDNDGGVFLFSFCDSEYFYSIAITDNFGAENASHPILNLTESISSMPEVDDETITVDETTGKLRTTYGDYLGETEITWLELENIDTSQFSNFTFEQNGVTYTLKAAVSAAMLEHSPWQPSTLSTIAVESNNDDFSLTVKQKIITFENMSAYTLSSISFTVAQIIISAAMSSTTYSNLDSDDKNLIQTIDWSQGTFVYAEVPSQNMCIIILSEEFYNNNITKITVTCPKDQYATINSKALDLGEGLFVDNNNQLSCSYGKHITSSLDFDTLERFTTLKFNSTSPNTTAMSGYYTFFGDNNCFEANPANIIRFSSSQFSNELMNFIINGYSRKVYFTGIPMKNLNPETVDDYIELELQPITDSTIVSNYENLGWVYNGISYPQLFAATYGTNNTLDEIISGTMTTATGYDYSFVYILAISLSDIKIGNTILTNDENFVTTINGLDDQTSDNEDNYMQIYWGVEKTSYDMLPIKGLPNIGGIDNGSDNLIIGQNNEILHSDSEDNIIIGNKNKLFDITTSRDDCILIGENLYLGRDGQKILGRYNIPLDSFNDEDAFIIGSSTTSSVLGLNLTDPDGNSHQRYNPLVLRSNGNLYIGGNIYTNTSFTAGSSFTNNSMSSSNIVVTRNPSSSVSSLDSDATTSDIINKINSIITFLQLDTTK